MRDPELVGKRLHRRLARGDRARHDQHVVAARLLARCELQHGECGPSDVQSRDRMDDPHGVLVRAMVATAGASLTVSQKTAASGVPPKRPSPAIAPSVPAVQAAGMYAVRSVAAATARTL